MDIKNTNSFNLSKYNCYFAYARSICFQFFIGEQLTGNYAFTTLLFASVLLVITNIWQVPFCFFLAKKFGFIASIVVNAVLGLVVGILLADGSMWIYCPYSWGIRLMVPVMRILPNGVPTEVSIQ